MNDPLISLQNVIYYVFSLNKRNIRDIRNECNENILNFNFKMEYWKFKMYFYM